MDLSVLNLAKKAELPLGEFIQLLSHEHTYETVVDMTREFILTSPSADIQKKGLDFFYMHGLQEELQTLIEKNRNASCTSRRDWAAYYQLMFDRSFHAYNPQTFLEKLCLLKTEEPELNCLVKLAQMNACFDMNNFDKAADILVNQTAACPDVEDSYLRSSINTRTYCYLFMYYWIRNELVIARKYAYKALNKMISPSMRASVHAYLGLSYLYDTYNQGMYHLSEALKIARKHQLTNLIYVIEQRYIPFLSAYCKRPDGVRSALTYEQAHLEIAKENYAAAIEMLQNLPMDNPFVQYYMGVASRDKQMLSRSYNHFIEKESNYFFSRMPLKALQEMEIS
jgi:hypothetical protein